MLHPLIMQRSLFATTHVSLKATPTTANSNGPVSPNFTKPKHCIPTPACQQDRPNLTLEQEKEYSKLTLKDHSRHPKATNSNAQPEVPRPSCASPGSAPTCSSSFPDGGFTCRFGFGASSCTHLRPLTVSGVSVLTLNPASL